MKKEYVKPMMESEEFVVREYIAACYNVYCKGFSDADVDGKLVVDWGNRYSSYEHKCNDDFVGRIHDLNELGTKTVRYSPWGIGLYDTHEKDVTSYGSHWAVSYESCATEAHPNASD